MYRLVPLLILLFSLATTVSAQVTIDEARDSARRAGDVNYVALTYAPLATIAGRPRFSAGALISRRSWAYAIDLEYGPNFLIDSPLDGEFLAYELYGLRAELRRRVGRGNYDRPSYLTHYLGLQGSYRTAYRDLLGRRYESRSGEWLEFDRGRRQEEWTELVPIYTLQWTVASRLLIECYTGVGVTYRQVRYQRQMGLQPATADLADIILPFLWLWRNSNREGNYFLPALRGGLKVGVRL